MAIRVELIHQTLYQYNRPAFLSPQLIRLKPAAHSRTVIESYQLTIEPANHVVHEMQEPFGNFVTRVDFTGSVTSMTIRIQLIANLEPINPFDFFIDGYASSFPFDYEAPLKKALTPYLEITEQGHYLTQWIHQLKQHPRQDSLDFLIGLNQQVNQAITYQVRLQAGVQPADVTLRRAIGSCRDSAWLLVQLLRSLGLAARFVSGYLAQVATHDSSKVDSSSDVVNSLDLHAWAEVYLPGAGWIGLDPTSGMLATEGHIPLACAPDPTEAAPVTGTTGSSETELTFTSTLTRLT
ncbi:MULTISPECIES: transglutaminase family protein [unclassified Spirosoma]|uniref:transglutaminase family protein n=1 Tax=unclassified Spirosoma TaxID=2621999 RepID=UPI00096524E0|nr:MULTISPECIES: transglutaminase family protein [unclassified Spirosoma]MBN8821533.1 transglutaminase family protein [Spirosoma sp.]OJW78309.1 MAG: transglutaminase [Spirosoma sp. 48-14]